MLSRWLQVLSWCVLCWNSTTHAIESWQQSLLWPSIKLQSLQLNTSNMGNCHGFITSEVTMWVIIHQPHPLIFVCWLAEICRLWWRPQQEPAATLLPCFFVLHVRNDKLFFFPGEGQSLFIAFTQLLYAEASYTWAACNGRNKLVAQQMTLQVSPFFVALVKPN